MATLPILQVGQVLTDSDGIATDVFSRWLQLTQSQVTTTQSAVSPNAQFIVRIADSTAPFAQALSSLSTGFVKVANGSGVLSSQTQIQSSDIATAAVSTSNLTTTGVTAGSYGDGTHVPTVTVGVDGRVTSIANQPIAYPATPVPLVSILVTVTDLASFNTVFNYSNGSGGVGATLTVVAPNTAVIADSYPMVLGDTVLLTGLTSSPQRGIYTLTTLQAVGISAVLTRSTSYDTPAKINAAGVIAVLKGTLYTGNQYYLTLPMVTIGVTGMTYAQFNLTLRNPSVPALGGIHSLVAISHKFATGLATTGDLTIAQPAFTDISGSATAGQLPTTLTSGTAITNAALTTPTLGTPASGNLSNCTLAPGGLIGVQQFAGVGANTYTPTAGMKNVLIYYCGGGGGSGGCKGLAGNNGCTGGGGAGATGIVYLTAAQIGASITLTVGAGGAAGVGATPTSGGVGGTSYVGTAGSHLSQCVGGNGSVSNTAQVGTNLLPGGVGGAFTNTTGTVIASFTGQGGSGGLDASGGAYPLAGVGGSCLYFGNGGVQVSDRATNGATAGQAGSGASGAVSYNGTNGDGASGGSGAFFLYEYS